MNIARNAAIAIFAVLASCTAVPTASPNAIYAALLSEPGRTYYIQEKTIAPDLSSRLEGFAFPTDGKTHNLRLFGSVRVRIVSDTDQKALFAKGCAEGWRAFHQRHPEAKVLVALSEVSYRGDEAAVYVETGGGCLAGTGVVHIFQREGTEWKLRRTTRLWVS